MNVTFRQKKEEEESVRTTELKKKKVKNQCKLEYNQNYYKPHTKMYTQTPILTPNSYPILKFGV